MVVLVLTLKNCCQKYNKTERGTSADAAVVAFGHYRPESVAPRKLKNLWGEDKGKGVVKKLSKEIHYSVKERINEKWVDIEPICGHFSHMVVVPQNLCL